MLTSSISVYSEDRNMADRNRQLLSAAVSGILASLASTSNNQTTSNNQESSSSSSAAIGQTVRDHLGTLFPQCGQRSELSRGPETGLPKFDARTKPNSFGGKKRKRNVKSEKEYSFAKDIVLKDVVLLPSPEYKKVPRGKAREILYAEGYVSSAIEIHGNWCESDARKALEEQFKEKLKDLPPPRFEFVRAVGNTIVKPQIKSEQGWTGKVIKHQTGQGPLYIRATKDISILEIDSEDESLPPPECKDLKSYFNVKVEPESTSYENTTQANKESFIPDNKALMIATLKSMFPYQDEEKYGEIAEGSSTLNEAVDKMIDWQSEDIFAPEVNFDQSGNDIVDDHVIPPAPTTLQDVLAGLEPFKFSHNRINVSRESIFQDSIAIFKNPGFDMSKPCKIVFEDEPAIDGGGPKREYFALLLASLLSPNIPVRLFEGQSNRILPIHNSDALRAHLFKVAGKMIASSVINGGACFPHFSPAAYTYIATNSIQAVLDVVGVEDIPDTEILDCINQIDNYIDGSEVEKSVADCLVDAGFTKTLTVENKGEAMMTVMLHCVILSRKAELDQFTDGLGPLLTKIRSNADICKPLLVQSVDDTKVTAEKLKSLLVFEKLTEPLQQFLIDYIEMKDEQRLSEFLMFCTGSPTIPPLGFHDPEKITVSEIESSLPNVNTCPMIIELPNKPSSFEQFCDALDTAISCQSHGFGIL